MHIPHEMIFFFFLIKSLSTSSSEGEDYFLFNDLIERCGSIFHAPSHKHRFIYLQQNMRKRFLVKLSRCDMSKKIIKLICNMSKNLCLSTKDCELLFIWYFSFGLQNCGPATLHVSEPGSNYPEYLVRIRLINWHESGISKKG